MKTLIAIMLAQGQEVFLEKQVADGKKSGLLAKLASQAAYLYGQAAEGVQDNVTKGIFEKSWLALVHVSRKTFLLEMDYFSVIIWFGRTASLRMSFLRNNTVGRPAILQA